MTFEGERVSEVYNLTDVHKTIINLLSHVKHATTYFVEI